MFLIFNCLPFIWTIIYCQISHLSIISSPPHRSTLEFFLSPILSCPPPCPQPTALFKLRECGTRKLQDGRDLVRGGHIQIWAHGKLEVTQALVGLSTLHCKAHQLELFGAEKTSWGKTVEANSKQMVTWGGRTTLFSVAVRLYLFILHAHLVALGRLYAYSLLDC